MSKKGIIYKITCNKTGECYFGSTFKPLAQRMYAHKSESSKCSARKIIERGDYSAKVILECYVADKVELRKIESTLIRNNKCINQTDSYRSPEEKAAARRAYYQKNKFMISEKRKIKLQCSCGRLYTIQNKARHEKTTAHNQAS